MEFIKSRHLLCSNKLDRQILLFNLVNYVHCICVVSKYHDFDKTPLLFSTCAHICKFMLIEMLIIYIPPLILRHFCEIIVYHTLYMCWHQEGAHYKNLLG